MRSGFVVILLLSVLSFCSAVYFQLEEGQTKCFLEEVPRDTLIVGKYSAEEIVATGNYQAYPPAQGEETAFGIRVTVNDPEGGVILQRDMKPIGRVAFTSQVGGEYKVCFQTNTTRWFGKKSVRFHLSLEAGVSATDYEQVAKQEHLSEIELTIRKLNDRVKEVRSEQSFQRNREAVFRNTSESTNGRVMWWSIIQTSILVGAGIWQISHLKHFFKAKKLV